MSVVEVITGLSTENSHYFFIIFSLDLSINYKNMKSSLLVLIFLLPLVICAARTLESIRISMERQIRENPGSLIMSRGSVMKDNCIMKAYNQTITSKRCSISTIPNSFCSGLCNSIDIPARHNIKSSRSCSATKTIEELVPLDCPKRKRKYKLVKIIRALECGCSTCSNKH